MIDNPHFDFPFRIAANGRVAVVEQDSADEIAVSTTCVLRYVQGQRPEAPAYGRPRNLNFKKGPLDIDSVVAAVAASEPRAGGRMLEDPAEMTSAVRRLAVYIESES